MISLDIDALTDRFLDEWTGTLPVVFDSAPPVDTTNGYVRFFVRPGASKHYCGDTTYGLKKQQGRVWLEIVIPEGHGDRDALDMIDAFARIFRNWRNGAIYCETEDMKEPIDIEGNMVKFSLSVYWWSLRPYSG